MTKRPRTAAVRIRLTSEEHAAITAAGQAIGLGLCSFARMAVVKAAKLKPPPPRRRPDSHAMALAQWTTELNRLGSNLNQLARDHNSRLRVDPVRLDSLRSEVRELREAVLRFHTQGPDQP